MAFVANAMRVFDRAGLPVGTLTGWSVTGPRTYRLNEVEDFAFTMPRNSGTLPIIGSSVAAGPAFIAATTPAPATATSIALANPAGVQHGDVLLAAIAIDLAGNTTRDATPPPGWARLGTSVRNGSNHALLLYQHRWATGGATTRTFTLSGATGPLAASLLAFRGVFRLRVGGAEVTTLAANDDIFLPDLPLGGSIPNSLRVNIVAADRSATFVHLNGATERVESASAGVSLGVASRLLAATGGPSRDQVTASVNAELVGASLIYEPTYGTEQLLMRDNIVYLDNDIPSMPGWAGYIDQVNYADGSVDVKCLGTMGLFARLNTDQIVEEEGSDVAAVALRLVKAANAKKAAHGDIEVGFTTASTKPLLGTYTFEGDVLRGLQGLLTDTISEAYMWNRLDASGRLLVDIVWGDEFRIEKRGVAMPGGGTLTLRDGVGGNLTPGTEISFSGAERANYGRLVGTQTQAAALVDYQSVGGVITEITPIATVVVPESDLPGARRREALDLSVNWGYSKAQQQAIADYAQDRYITHYKNFLYAHHERWGEPFLEGFEWSGPTPERTRKLSLRSYRTVLTLGRLGAREVVTNWDPDEDADVTLEGWHYQRTITPPSQCHGLALDYSEPRYRLAAFASYEGVQQAVVSMRAAPPFEILEDSAWRAALTGESIYGLATDPAETTSVWVLTRTDTGSWIRRWDIASHERLSEWYVADPTLNDIAVDVPQGLLWSVRTDVAALQKRDLNSGDLLATFTIGVAHPMGLSVPAPGFGYILGLGGRLEIRHLDDGAFAGAKDITSDYDMTGLFVDPGNAQVWLLKGAARIDQYAAAIAVDAAGPGGGPSEGAPGFSAVSKGTFVRIVASDSRSTKLSPADHPSAHHLLDVTHRNQIVHLVNGKWVLWPPSVINGKTYQLAYSNCVPASACMALDRHTYHKTLIQPQDMRERMKDTVGPTGLSDVARAWRSYGHDFNYTYGGKWWDLVERLREGRGIVTLGDFDGIPEKYKCQGGYGGDHALYIHRMGEDGRMLVHDPLCRARKWIPAEHIRRYCEKYTGKKNRANFGWTRDTTKGKDTGSRNPNRARSFFMVWSEGKWKEELTAGGIGEPMLTQKTWDPGNQKSGFKEGAKVSIVSPEQVIYGEEGRVDDWDPVTMGYGKKGRHYYRTQSGDARYADGWHMVPWDIPASSFALGSPPWPEGEEFLRRMLDKFNREQGQQVLGVVNREGVWAHLVLGGIYTLQASLQGPYPAGITGTVRITGYAPDENNGVTQVQAEWLG